MRHSLGSPVIDTSVIIKASTRATVCDQLVKVFHKKLKPDIYVFCGSRIGYDVATTTIEIKENESWVAYLELKSATTVLHTVTVNGCV